MLSIKDMRDNIADGGEDLSDEQIIKLRDDMEAFANIAFDIWLEEKKKPKKNPSSELPII